MSSSASPLPGPSEDYTSSEALLVATGVTGISVTIHMRLPELVVFTRAPPEHDDGGDECR